MEQGVKTKRFLKVAEVAQELNCAVSSVYDMIARRDLTSVRIGGAGHHRIPREELERVIEESLAPSRRRIA